MLHICIAQLLGASAVPRSRPKVCPQANPGFCSQLRSQCSAVGQSNAVAFPFLGSSCGSVAYNVTGLPCKFTGFSGCSLASWPPLLGPFALQGHASGTRPSLAALAPAKEAPGVAGGGAFARVFRGTVSTSQDAILCSIGQCAEGASGASAPACADRLCAACKSYVKLTRQHAARRNPAWFGSLGVSRVWPLQAA